MTRWIIFVVVLAIAVTVFALVDSILARGDRVRVFSKPVWILLCVLLPVVGAALWFAFGRYYASTDTKKPYRQTKPPRGSSARPSFNPPSRPKEPSIEELEEELRNLEEEIDQNSKKDKGKNKKSENPPGKEGEGKEGDQKDSKPEK